MEDRNVRKGGGDMGDDGNDNALTPRHRTRKPDRCISLVDPDKYSEN